MTLSRSVCPGGGDCEGTGEVYEPCACSQCEYQDTHGQMVPCPDCRPWEDEDPRHYAHRMGDPDV